MESFSSPLRFEEPLLLRCLCFLACNDNEMRELLERCPGARGAAIVDPDGIPVAVNPDDAALEALGTEFSSIVSGVERAGSD